MAESYEKLTVEINRIVNSPYPTQLKHLRDNLCTRCSELDVSRWVHARPCQITRLTSCILEGLRQWPYVLEILEKLSHNVRIRDAFLRHEPTLLHDVVQQAVKSPDIQSKYTSAAVALLSFPLPQDVAMPSEVQSLFIRMFDYAAEQPAVARIKPIHRMLRATSSSLLGLLFNSVLLRFEDHVFNILRNIKGDNHSLSLYCLAIIRSMISTTDDRLSFSISSYDTQELLASTQVTSSKWTPDAMQQFFAEAKAQKTMQLIVLRAMWACTGSSGEAYDERMESLLLANEVISAVPTHLRERWRKDNAIVFRKLEEKTMAPELELGLRFQALCFLARLTEGGMALFTATDSLRIIVKSTDTITEALLGGEDVNLNVLAISGVFDQNTTTALVQNVVDFVASANAEDVVKSSSILQRAVRLISAIVVEEESVAEGTMLALDVLSCGNKLQSLRRLTTIPLDDNEGRTRTTICSATLRAARNTLVHELCNVFLTAALSSRHSTYAVGQDTTSLLLNLHATSAQLSPPCHHSRQERFSVYQSAPFVETASTPEDADFDWRSSIKAHFDSRARYEQGAITVLFAKACADLEIRCANVEKPLRAEQERRQALEKQIEDFDNAFTNLETDTIDRNIRLNALEMERDQYISDLEAARQETERLTQKVEELESSLKHNNTEAEKKLKELKRAKELADMVSASAFAKKEEEVEELQEQLRSCQDGLKGKSSELDVLQDNSNKIVRDLDTANRETDQLRLARNELQQSLDRQRSEHNKLIQRRTKLETQLHETEGRLSATNEIHQLELAGLQRQARDAQAVLSSSHEQKVADITRQREELETRLTKELQVIRDESREAQANLASTIQQRDVEISEKQKKIDKLNRRCEQKDKQIADANAMRSNLMAAMGINGGLQYQTNLPHRPSRSSTMQTQHQELDSQLDPSPPTPLPTDSAESQEAGVRASFGSNVSSTESRSGPTPKRARPRRSVKAPSPAKPRQSTGVSTRTARPSVSRQGTSTRRPLLSINANQAQRTSMAPKTPSRAMSKAALDDLDESTFDGSELFAGTPGERMLDMECTLNGNFENEY